ncbi:MAG: glycosyltransferase family 39 protein [Candidatus Aenigmarchaeota archaeon]|nr:glycosyltransferase family 39 protein [Candidatus Aenigmarchaeota archaeon]
MFKLRINFIIITIFLLFLLIRLLITQNYVWGADEGTHLLIGFFIKDIISNLKNFDSIKDLANFATNFVVKYPKVTPSYPPIYHIFIASILFFSENIIVLRIFNIVILLLTSYIIYLISKEIIKDEKYSILGIVIFLTFSSMFHYADKIMTDIIQILVFSLTIFYYIKLKNKKSTNKIEYIKLGVLLAVSMLTKFFSFFLYPIIFLDSILSNKKLLKYIILAFVVSFIILSPYGFLVWKFKLYKLIVHIATTPFGSKLRYFDLNLNFGYILGPFVAISLIYFMLKNHKNYFYFIWLLIPMITFMLFADSDNRFAFLLMPIYIISSVYSIKELSNKYKKYNKIIFLIFFALIFAQTVINIKNNYIKERYPVNEIMNITKTGGNVLILSENPIFSSIYVLYGRINNIEGNVIRPCIFWENNLSKKLLNDWGIEYIIDQKNNMNKKELEIEKIFEGRANNEIFILYKNKKFNNIDCNYICILKGELCKNDGLNTVLELIKNIN